MDRDKTWTGWACSGLVLIALAGCGGDGGSGPPPSGGGTTGVKTTVLDGAIANALVCIDKNANGSCDGDETQGRTDAGGTVTLDVPDDDVGKYALVAQVGTDAVDAEHGPVTTAYKLAAPADQTAVISPLTTLVVQKMAAAGIGSAQAAAALQVATGIGGSLFADYTQNAASDGAVAPATLARLLVLAEQKQSSVVAAALGTPALDGQAISAADLERAVSNQVVVMLGDLVAAAADPALAGAPADELEAALDAAAADAVAASGLSVATAPTIVAIQNQTPSSDFTPAPAVQLAELNYTDSSNFYARLLTGSLAQKTPDANNETRFVDRRLRSTAGQLAKWGSGSDPWRNADLHWDGAAWSACPLNFESRASVRDANGNIRFDYCNGLDVGTIHQATFDVAGQAMADVYAQARALGFVNLTIADAAALGSTAFPSGSQVQYQNQTDASTAIGYYPAGANSPAGTSNVVTEYSAAVSAGGDATAQPAGTACNSSESNTAGSPSTTLEGLVASKTGTPCVYAQASFVYAGVTYTSDGPDERWGNSTVSLGKLGTVALNTGSAPGYFSGNTLLRIAFKGSGTNPVTYYACQERFNNGSVRKCTAIGSGSYTVATLGDARVMTFGNPPAQASSLTYERVFVERAGAVYFGYRSKPRSGVLSVRFNAVASNALLAQLGVPSEDPETALALTAGSYQGTWDARDVTETSPNAGETIFLRADGSASCQDRESAATFACSITLTDAATGAFTLSDGTSSASGSFDFIAGTGSGTYHDPTSTPADGSFVAYRR